MSMPENPDQNLRIWINGSLQPPENALISVFDSGFVLGDGVWEGLRVVKGQPVFLEAHLDRLFEGAAALALAIGASREELARAVYETIEENDLVDDAHLRVMVTRGIRTQPYQDPRLIEGGSTIVIIPGHHPVTDEMRTHPLTLFTVHVRRGYPDVQDPGINSHSKLNCITACIQAAEAGADEALMLDPHGFVATCNSTHFFIVRQGQVWTSTGNYCLKGITRGHVLDLCRENDIACQERTFSLTEVYGAEEAFITGTLTGLKPVGKIDGRTIGTGQRGRVTHRLQELYDQRIRDDAVARRSRS